MLADFKLETLHFKLGSGSSQIQSVQAGGRHTHKLHGSIVKHRISTLSTSLPSLGLAKLHMQLLLCPFLQMNHHVPQSQRWGSEGGLGALALKH